MVQSGSRFIDPTESRYAMIELECLGAAWAMKKCKSFLEGLPMFEVVLDHRPLIPILNDYTLDQLDNQRLLRLRLKMSRFSFRARWVPGKENIEADALSRSPVDQPTKDDLLGEGPMAYTARKAVVGIIAEWAGSKERPTASHSTAQSLSTAPKQPLQQTAISKISVQPSGTVFPTTRQTYRLTSVRTGTNERVSRSTFTTT